jgi:hypothetical protein
MGMFDYVDINYDLPMPENAVPEHVVFIINSIAADNFQTKDFECMLDVYYLDKEGFLYQQISDKYKEYYVHQHVRCYTYIKIPSEDASYWLEYDLKFTDGKLEKATAVEWKKMDSFKKIDLELE